MAGTASSGKPAALGRLGEDMAFHVDRGRARPSGERTLLDGTDDHVIAAGDRTDRDVDAARDGLRLHRLPPCAVRVDGPARWQAHALAEDHDPGAMPRIEAAGQAGADQRLGAAGDQELGLTTGPHAIGAGTGQQWHGVSRGAPD